MIGFLVLCVALVATIAGVVSVVTGGVALAAGRRLDRLAPAAQSRVLLAVVIAPAAATLILIAAWVVDILVLGCRAHHCLENHSSLFPGALSAFLGSVLLVRVGLAYGRVAHGLWRARRARFLFDDASSSPPDEMCVIPFEEPHAFVAGMLRPRVYVSRGLLAVAAAGDLPPVLAHERAHAERRDPLRRVIASLALAYHLPGIAPLLERRLARAHELAADAEAARVVGDGHRVAEVIVRFARVRVSRLGLSPASSWFGGDLEVRVGALLAAGVRTNRPSAASLVTVVVALFVIALVAADPIHSGGEILLGLLDR
jgi:Zn-dependent protease with chaperone function